MSILSSLGPDVYLYILSLLQFKDICAFHLLSRDTYHFLVNHETVIFHQLAILHRYVSSGTSLKDAILAEQDRGDWLRGVRSWKELCQRWVSLERNWSGEGEVVVGAHLFFDTPVRAFKLDEIDKTILAIVDCMGSLKRSLVVRDAQSDKLLWTLEDVDGFKYSNGMLVLAHNNGGGAEIWRRTAGIHTLGTSLEDAVMEGPFRHPSPLALSPAQERWLQSEASSYAGRGRYEPYGFLPSYNDRPFRIDSFHFPILAVIDGSADHVVQLYDVLHGTMIRRLDLDQLAEACSDRGRSFYMQSILLDIDLTDDLICATLDGSVLITPIRAADDTDASAVASTLMFTENLELSVSRESSLHLVRLDSDNLDVVVNDTSTGGGGYSSVMSILCKAQDAMQQCKVAPGSKVPEEATQALVRVRRPLSSFFISGKFSPDGQHVVVGSAFGLLYLLPNISDTISGLTKVHDTMQKLDVMEPLRDVVWQEQNHRIVVRTEPGDTLLVNLNPGYYKDVSLASETTLKFETALVHRLHDFCNPYGTNYGNVQVTRSAIWFVWDAVMLHKTVCERMKVPEGEHLLGNRAVTVCFMSFSPISQESTLV